MLNQFYTTLTEELQLWIIRAARNCEKVILYFTVSLLHFTFTYHSNNSKLGIIKCNLP